MDFARAWLPKARTRLVTFVLAAGVLTWLFFAVSGPVAEGALLHEKARRPHRPPAKMRPYPPPHERTIWHGRAEQVKEAFLHAYRGYLKYAGSHDELLPVSQSAVDK